MDFPIDSMVIFNSYVKLPEGIQLANKCHIWEYWGILSTKSVGNVVLNSKNHAIFFFVSKIEVFNLETKAQPFQYLTCNDLSTLWKRLTNGILRRTHHLSDPIHSMKAIVGLLKSSTHIHNTYLVGGIFTPLKNMKVSWEGLSHILWKIKNLPNHRHQNKIWIITQCWIV